MSAIYQSDHYGSKLDAPANVRYRRRIDELFKHIRKSELKTCCVIEFGVADGSIQGVSFTERQAVLLVPFPEFHAGFGCLNSVYEKVLTSGWHGHITVEIKSTVVEPRRLFFHEVTVKQNFR